MNYIELINRFWELDEGWQFSCCETRLYFYLVKTANRLGWEDNWTHSDDKTSANVGVSLNKMKHARNRLVQAGLIECYSGGKGYGSKTRYRIRCQNLTPKVEPKSTPKSQPKVEPKSQPINKQKLKHNNTPYNPPTGDASPESEKEKSEKPINPPTQPTDTGTGSAGNTPPGSAAPPSKSGAGPQEKEIVQAIVNYYHEHCKGLCKVKIVTDKRRKAVMARYREYGAEAVRTMLLNAGKSQFLAGQNQRGWSANFDWLFLPNNFVKVYEGRYQNNDYSNGDRFGKNQLAIQPTAGDKFKDTI